MLLGVPSVLLLGIASAAPDKFLELVFHHAYTSAADACSAPLVVAMILLSVSVVLTMYLLAVGQRWVVAVLVGGAAALTVAVLTVQMGPPAPRQWSISGCCAGSGARGDRGGLRTCPQGNFLGFRGSLQD